MDTIMIMNCLREKGERLTLPRRLVIEALGQAHTHQTIKDIQQYINATLDGQPLSETTIYRVLQWLKELEIVSQSDMGQNGIVYALTSNPYHHHLVCLRCGITFTVEDELFASLRENLNAKYGFEARIEHMVIYGQCEKCHDQPTQE